MLAAAVMVFARLKVELNYAVFGSGIVLLAIGMSPLQSPLHNRHHPVAAPPPNRAWLLR